MARRKQKLCPGCNTVFVGKATAMTCSARCRKRMERTRRALTAQTAKVEGKTASIKDEIEVKLAEAKETVQEEASEFLESAEQALMRLNPQLIPQANESGFVATGAAAQPMGIPPKPAEPLNSLNPPQTVAPKLSEEDSGQRIDVKITPSPAVQPARQAVINPSPAPTVTPTISQPAEEPLTKSLAPSESLEAPSTSAPSIVAPVPAQSAANSPPLSVAQGFVDTGASEQKAEAPPKYKITQGLKDYFKLPLWGKIALAASPFLVALIMLASFYLGHRQNSGNNISLQTSVSSNATSKDLLMGSGVQALKLNVNTLVGNDKQLSAAGPVDFKNHTDSTRSFAVQNAAGNDLLVVDTKDNEIVLGSPDQAVALQINGNTSITGNVNVANGGASLSSTGLTLGSLVVCTQNGCIPDSKYLASLQGSNISLSPDASQITTGTLSDSRLSTNVALLNASQTFTGVNNFLNASNSFSGSGANITALDASNISSGTLQNSRLNTDVALLDRNGQIFTGTQAVQATSATALQVQNSGGATTLLVADTQNGRLGIGTSTPTDTLSVVGNSSLVQSSVSAPSITASGNEITDNVRLASVQGDGETYPDSSYGIWLPTTNLEPNGGMENGVTGWQAVGSASAPAQDGTTAKFGTHSMKIVTNGVASGEGATTGPSGSLGLPGATWFTASAWVKGSGTIVLAVKEYSSIHTLLQTDTSGPVILSSAWQRVTVSFLTHSGTASGDITLVTNGSEAITFWADGIQLEANEAPTPYIDTNGSTAVRNAARVRIPTTGLDTAQGWVAARIRFDNPSNVCLEGGVARVFEWALDDNNRILMNYDCTFTQFEAVWISNGFAVTKATSYTFPSGTYITLAMEWFDGPNSSFVGLSVNGSAFSKQPAGHLTPIDLSSVPMFDIGSSFGGTSHLDGDIMWFTAGAGTLTDSDPATLYGLGNTDPNMLTLPSTASTQLTWQANNAFYLNTTYQPIVLNVRNSLGTSIFGVDASSSSILMPGLTSSSSALVLGNDANLYRSAANSLKTDGNFTTGGNLTINGAALFQDLTDSTTALQVQNAGGTTILNIDTANGFVGINTASPQFTLDVNGSINLASGKTISFGGTGEGKPILTNVGPVTAAQGTLTNIACLGTGYYSGTITMFGRRSTDSANTSVITAQFRMDYYQATITKISEQVRNGGAADTVGATGTTNANKCINITTSATGTPGDTIWNAILTYSTP